MQARPDDYPLSLLKSQHVISFHKHWMIDPIQVYSDWFRREEEESEPSESSSPLDHAAMDPPGELLDATVDTSSLFDGPPKHRRLSDEL